MQPAPLSPAPRNLVLASSSKSWSTISRMLGLVVLVAFMSQLAAVISLAPLLNEPGMAFGGAICMLPLMLIFFFARREKMLDVHLITPNPQGRFDHFLPGNRLLKCPQPAIASRHLIRDSPPLEMPKASMLWMLFFGGVIISIIGFIPVLVNPDSAISWLLVVLIAIPALIVGFATPAFAWWSFSTTHLRLKTSRHSGEAMMIAGMLSTIPAIMINSALSPTIISLMGIDSYQISELLILAISAPVGEEICKALAVLACSRYIDSAKRGFQVGCAVGLGFAIVENLFYISGSFGGGRFVAITYGLTTIVRGIGSIPGHALWTGISGYAIGHHLQNKQNKQSEQSGHWVLFDQETGHRVAATGELASKPPNWLIINPSKAWRLPSNPSTALLFAILGHAAWNGSSWASTWLGERIAGEAGLVIATLGWTVVLLIVLWIIGRNVLASVFLHQS